MAPLGRRSVTVDGTELSVLVNGDGPAQLLLLHGTFWSRVWQASLPAFGDSVQVAALDLPGCGRSGGELTIEQAQVPALAALALRAADALGMPAFTVAGHDIGGAVAQHLTVHHANRARRLVLVDSVLYDSWPVPAVARFRDASVRDATSPEAFRNARREALRRAVTRRLPETVEAEYLSPWDEDRRIRSWMAIAAAAHPRHTLELVPALRESPTPMLLIWGEDDEFQPVAFAERFAAEVGSAQLAVVPRARHIPMEDDPDRVAGELLAFLEMATLAEGGD
jgi:pimeloyl-ACP methyl ester carboxylesterase